MGLNFFARKCNSSPYAVQDSNPNPEKFSIIKEHYENGYLVLEVSYPNCTNFEGRKLMLYQGFRTSQQLLKYNNGKLDPHFADSKGAPIGRFKPDKDGLRLIALIIQS